MGNVEIGIYCCLTVDVFDKSFTEVSLSSPLPNMYLNFFQTAEFDWFRGLFAMATKILNLRKNIKKSSTQKP